MALSLWCAPEPPGTLTVCCAVDDPEARRTRCCDVSEQTGNLLETVKLGPHIQTSVKLYVCVMLDGSVIPWSLQFVMGATATPHRNKERSQSLVDLMQDPLTLEAAAPAVQTSHQDAVRADQRRVPAKREAVRHSLATGGAVTVRGN
ncbi:hypothetical protein EYF80_057361 [Liparis tanakae]|uniref:Uncharacterized protein n=1 Tax=Liparis tanakae TaxID=230148 RepID=A0A4Z2EUL0_9TELE|nr:hypothetical protein EYF80_057361 [Liparis tanakae]